MNEQSQENINQGEQLPTKGPSPNTKLLAVIVVVLGVLIAVVAGVYFYTYQTSPKEVACTQEAKICPDGSAVGRTGPNCEFAACPSSVPSEASVEEEALCEGEKCLGEDDTRTDTSNLASSEVEGWKTYRNEEYGFEVKYPPELFVEIEQVEEDIPFSTDMFFFKDSKESLDSVFAIIPFSLEFLDIETLIYGFKNSKSTNLVSEQVLIINDLEITYLIIEEPVATLPTKEKVWQKTNVAFISGGNLQFQIAGPDSPSIDLPPEKFLSILSTFRLIK